MNKTRLRNHWTPVEEKYRKREGDKLIKAVRVFSGWYKG